MTNSVYNPLAIRRTNGENRDVLLEWNVTLKVLQRTRECLQLAPPTPPGVLSLPRWTLQDLLGIKGLQDRVWSPGLTFWGGLG